MIREKNIQYNTWHMQQAAVEAQRLNRARLKLQVVPACYREILVPILVAQFIGLILANIVMFKTVLSTISRCHEPTAVLTS